MIGRISSFCLNKSSRLNKNFLQISAFARCITSSSSNIVQTEYGPIKGDQRLSVLGRKYFNFQGIPYMKAPLGKLRFRDAEAPGELNLIECDSFN